MNSELKNIDQSLSETLKKSDLKNVSIEVLESILDSNLEDGLFRDIPILNSIIGISKTAIGIKDYLYLKKIIRFLSELESIPKEQRKKVIDSIDNDPKERIKVGEKLVYIIDKCDDYLNAEYIGQFFSAFLNEKITYQEFLSGSRIIQNIFIKDLEEFLRTDINRIEKETSTEEGPDEEIFPLINAGICGFGYNPTSIEDQWDPDMSNKYIVEGGESVIWITSIGHKLKEILRIKN